MTTESHQTPLNTRYSSKEMQFNFSDKKKVANGAKTFPFNETIYTL